jgi:hypothetical protein
MPAKPVCLMYETDRLTLLPEPSTVPPPFAAVETTQSRVSGTLPGEFAQSPMPETPVTAAFDDMAKEFVTASPPLICHPVMVPFIGPFVDSVLLKAADANAK